MITAGTSVMANSFDMTYTSNPCPVLTVDIRGEKRNHPAFLLFQEMELYTISGTSCLNGWAPPLYHFVKNS